jgi:hypothetical protein
LSSDSSEKEIILEIEDDKKRPKQKKKKRKVDPKSQKHWVAYETG